MERNNVQALEQAIMEIAQQEVQTLLSEAQAKAESIRRQAEIEAQVEQKKIIQAAQQEVEKSVHQTIAKAQLEAQMLRLQRREHVLENTFIHVRGQLAAVADRPDYADVVRRLICEAVKYLGDEKFAVQADATTQATLTEAFLNDLSQELNVTLELGTPLDKGTGIALVTANGRRRYDNTLEARLARTQDNLRNAVYHILAQDDAAPGSTL